VATETVQDNAKNIATGPITTVGFTNIDNGSGGRRRNEKIIVTPLSGLNTAEGGSTATFTVVLDALPTSDVTINLSSSDTSEGTISPSTLIFTPTNGLTPQRVTVTGVDDALSDGNISYTITTEAAISTDSNYDGIDSQDVSVTNGDNDVTSGGGASGGGGGGGLGVGGGGGGGSSSNETTDEVTDGSVLGTSTNREITTVEADSNSTGEIIMTSPKTRGERQDLINRLQNLFGERFSLRTTAKGVSAGRTETEEGTMINPALNVLVKGDDIPTFTVVKGDNKITITFSHEATLLRPLSIVVKETGAFEANTLRITDVHGNIVNSFNIARNETLTINTNYLRDMTVDIITPETLAVLDDVAADPESEAITRLMELGIIKGHPDGTFKPNNALKRSETSKLIGLVLGLKADDTKDGDEWYSAILRALANAKIIKGTVSPEAFEQRANFLALVAKAKGINVGTLPVCTVQTFTDVATDTWYCPIVQYALKQEWIRETSGEFKPSDLVTRGWAAGVIDRAF
jgi:hypothetical protein